MFRAMFLWLFHPVCPFVLERFAPLNYEPNDGDPAVELVGRRGGMFGFLLSLVNLADRITFQITPGEARLTTQSKIGMGQHVHIVSLQAKPSVLVAAAAPWFALILGGLIVLMTLLYFLFTRDVYALLIGWPIGGLYIGYYFMGTAYSVHIVGSTHLRISVYPSFLNNQSITFDKLMKAIDLMRRLIDLSEVRTRSDPSGVLKGPVTDPEKPPEDHKPERTPVPSGDPETDAALAYTELMARADEFTRQPRAFLKELRQLVTRYPSTAAAVRGEWEARALEIYITTLERFQAKQLTKPQLRTRLGEIPDNFPTSLAATWAERFLNQ